MATQGLVSVLDGKQVLVKAVCGCNGYQAQALAEFIREHGLNEGHQVYDAAVEVGFGCRDCLVVLAVGGDTVYHDGEELSARYRETFNQPAFNPRWQHGTAEHAEIVQLRHNKALHPTAYSPTLASSLRASGGG